MTKEISTKQPHNNMKKNLVVYGAIALFFLIALFNVYDFFQEKRQAVLDKEAQRIAEVEQLKAEKTEAERKAKVQHEIEMQNLALEKEQKQAELLEQKVNQQKKLEQYQLLKDARRQATQKKRLTRRIESARKHKYIPEGISGKIRRGIESATYLTIRNNPKDYTGDYKPSSILKADKLTSGGANSLMLFSIISNDLKAIEEVINIGHNINTQNKSGHTALMFASAYNTPEVISFLIQQGADPKQTEFMTQGNSLHVSAKFNPKPEAIEALVSAGLDIEASDKDGNTPLLIATKHNQNLQVVEKLIELGADVNALDNTGKDAYGYAYERINKRVPMGRYSFISDEFQESVLNSLKPN